MNRGELQFGPVHTEKFWRINAERFKHKDFLLIRTLVAVLRSAVLSVPTVEENNDGGGGSGGGEEKKTDGVGAPSASSSTSSTSSSATTKKERRTAEDHHLAKHFAIPMSEETTAVACYDLGEFVRFFPAGKQLSNTLGIKYLVMALLQHPSVLVQEKALDACTKMLLKNHGF